MQRNAAIGLLLALTLTTTGCVQAVSGGPIAFQASEATVADSALQDNGYQLENTDTVTVDRTVDVPVVGQRDVHITNHVAVYSRTGGEAESDDQQSPGALFVLSTPQAQVAGQGTNPLGRVPTEELITRVTDRAGTEGEAEQVGTTTITVLGSSTTVEKYASTVQVEGESAEAFVYVTRVPHGDDYVIAVGVLPKQFEDHEGAIYALMKGIEHGED